MFVRSRLGRVARLVSLTLVESPAVGTASLSLHLSRTNPSRAYGFQLQADPGPPPSSSLPSSSPPSLSPPSLPPPSVTPPVSGSVTAAASSGAPPSRRYRLLEMPRFLTAASRALAALFPNSRVPQAGAVYLNAVNGCSAADAKGMMRALMEGRAHAVELSVEGMPPPEKGRVRKAPSEGDAQAESEQKTRGKLPRKKQKKVREAKMKLKGRRLRQAAPTKVVKETEEVGSIPPEDIEDMTAKIIAESLNDPSLNTDADPDLGDERSATKQPKGRKGRPSKRQSTGKKGDAGLESEENEPAEMSPMGEARAGNPLIDSTAAITELTKRLSTLVPSSDEASADETNLKGKRRGKKKSTDEISEEAETSLGKLSSKGNKGKARGKAKKNIKDLSKVKKSRRASAATGDAGDGVLDAAVTTASAERVGTKGYASVTGAKKSETSGSFTMEL